MEGSHDRRFQVLQGEEVRHPSRRRGYVEGEQELCALKRHPNVGRSTAPGPRSEHERRTAKGECGYEEMADRLEDVPEEGIADCLGESKY